jgi:hypothetical protein
MESPQHHLLQRMMAEWQRGAYSKMRSHSEAWMKGLDGISRGLRRSLRPGFSGAHASRPWRRERRSPPHLGQRRICCCPRLNGFRRTERAPVAKLRRGSSNRRHSGAPPSACATARCIFARATRPNLNFYPSGLFVEWGRKRCRAFERLKPCCRNFPGEPG